MVPVGTGIPKLCHPSAMSLLACVVSGKGFLAEMNGCTCVSLEPKIFSRKSHSCFYNFFLFFFFFAFVLTSSSPSQTFNCFSNKKQKIIKRKKQWICKVPRLNRQSMDNQFLSVFWC